MHNLRITYNVKNFEYNFRFTIDGEDLLISNPNFWELALKDQSYIVASYIAKDRQRFRIKKFYDQKWEPVCN